MSPTLSLIFDKAKTYIVPLLTMFWAFIEPIHGLMFATGALVFLDFVTGMVKAFRVKGEKISSRRMRETIGKSVLYLIAVLAGFFLDYITGLELAARAIAGVIALVECKSVLENIEEITGLNLWAVVAEKLKPPKKETSGAPETK